MEEVGVGRHRSLRVFLENVLLEAKIGDQQTPLHIDIGHIHRKDLPFGLVHPILHVVDLLRFEYPLVADEVAKEGFHLVALVEALKHLPRVFDVLFAAKHGRQPIVNHHRQAVLQPVVPEFLLVVRNENVGLAKLRRRLVHVPKGVNSLSAVAPQYWISVARANVVDLQLVFAHVIRGGNDREVNHDVARNVISDEGWVTVHLPHQAESAVEEES